MGRAREVRVALWTTSRPWPDRVPAESRVVVVDVLRATSTLSVALANGASRIVPLTDTAEALARRDADPGSLACGERDGRIVPGFDLGNSPFEYAPGRVRGRTLYFASTNGSWAMRHAASRDSRGDGWTLGSFVSANATLEGVANDAEVFVACAGKDGRFALEDAAFAGWLCARLAERGARPANDAARFALTLAPRDETEIRALVEGCSHGRYLRSLGSEFARDVEFCSRLDVVGGARTPESAAQT
ncbi:MAG: 2-phosphosulfolactate phosphatase [Candidatus Eisenbacteria bacterium]|nr:2-phosphosulfolactate phosphatase [Candidatus Eisenbacteria bacterium]